MVTQFFVLLVPQALDPLVHLPKMSKPLFPLVLCSLMAKQTGRIAKDAKIG